MSTHLRYLTAKRITLIGAAVNAALGLIKLMGGLLFHSHALAADGLHSFADLITDSMVLLAAKYSNQRADERHPYGYQRIETAATFFLALLLILTGIGIGWESTSLLINPPDNKPQIWALPIALVSVLANEGLFYTTRTVGARINSSLLVANAWHHRSDSASSFVVLVSLLSSLAGLHYSDAIAALIVGLLIVQMGVSYAWNSIKELVDTAIDPLQLAEIGQSIQRIDGVIKIHQLRSRMMGPDIFIDVHIQVSPFISVSEGHFIAQHVHYQLMKQVPTIKDVTVHVDPEDDEINPPSLHLPNRATLERQLLEPWREQFPALQSWTIHYLTGTITLDLFASHWTEAMQQSMWSDCAQINLPLQLHFFLITAVS